MRLRGTPMTTQANGCRFKILVETRHDLVYGQLRFPACLATNALVTEITNALSQVSKFKYAYADGQLIQSQDQNDINANRTGTTYPYSDPLRRLTQVNLCRRRTDRIRIQRRTGIAKLAKLHDLSTR